MGPVSGTIINDQFEYGNGAIGSLLKKIDQDKQVKSNIMSSVKKEPMNFNNQGGVAGHIREFRIDEETNMYHFNDPKLEPKQGGFNNSN